MTDLRIDTPEKERAVRDWVQANTDYDKSEAVKTMDQRILDCPNRSCAEAYRELMKYGGFMDDAELEAATDAQAEWQLEGGKCPRCIQTMKDHEESEAYKAVRRAEATLKKALGLDPRVETTLIFKEVPEVLFKD